MRRAIPLLVFAVLLAGHPPVGGSAPQSCSTKSPAAATVTGLFDASVEGGHVMVPFDVPDGVTRLEVHLCHDQPPTPLNAQLKHTLDLGLYEPAPDGRLWGVDEFRGWGGSSRPHVVLTAEDSTTVGYLPGPVPAGRWAAELGVAAVAGPDKGDPDGSVAWRLEVRHGTDPADADEPWQPAPYDDTPARREPGWYKGDFHVHAIHSNPSDAPMEQAFDYAFREAGLDFITLSDYVSPRSWHEIGRFQGTFIPPGKLVVRSTEVINYRGHVNNHASGRLVDHRTGPVYLWPDVSAPVRPARPAREIFEQIGEAGWTQVNHPTTFPSKVPGFDDLCRGCSWEYTDAETDWSKVDAMEVQTGPAGYTDPKGAEPGPNPFTPLAVEWWDRLRREGYDITAVGASDSHKAGGESLTTSPIGEATTVVYAPELSEDGIRRGIEAGHAYVKFFSPDGPDLRFTARPLGGGPEVIMGDELTATGAEFTAQVTGAFPGLPRVLVVMRDGLPYLSVPVTANHFRFTFPAAAPGDYRLQLQRLSAIEGLTNPITLRLPL